MYVRHERAAVDDGEALIQELDRLPLAQRDAVILRIQQRKSYGEISEITGIASDAVGELVHHGLRTLARRLKVAGVI